MFTEWISAFLAALGNSLVDLCKKKVVSKGLNTWEVMALLNSFLAISNIGYCIITDTLPSYIEPKVFLICAFKIVGKIIAQYTYLKSIQMAPLPSVIPYLAWNPVFLLIVGAILFNEIPTTLGVVGCLFVVAGAYIMSMNAKLDKEKNEKNDSNKTQKPISIPQDKSSSSSTFRKRSPSQNEENEDDEENSRILRRNNESPTHKNLQIDKQNEKPFFLITAIKDFWSFKAGLYMMGTTLCWTYTSTIEKYLFTVTKISSPLLLGIQSTLISAVVMSYCLIKSPKFVEQFYKSFFPLSGTCISETLGTLAYFAALQGGLYVSYVTAVKRAGNIFLSMMLSHLIYKDKLTKYHWMSAGSMIAGVCLIVLA